MRKFQEVLSDVRSDRFVLIVIDKMQLYTFITAFSAMKLPRDLIVPREQIKVSTFRPYSEGYYGLDQFPN